jgi:hypothetical protein
MAMLWTQVGSDRTVAESLGSRESNIRRCGDEIQTAIQRRDTSRVQASWFSLTTAVKRGSLGGAYYTNMEARDATNLASNPSLRWG